MDEHDEQRKLTYQWVQDVADRDHGGVWIAAAIALLNAARLRDQRPEDPWAEVTARQQGRGRG